MALVSLSLRNLTIDPPFLAQSLSTLHGLSAVLKRDQLLNLLLR